MAKPHQRTHGERRRTRVPQGKAFLAVIRKLERACEERTRKRIPQLGSKAPKLVVQIGTLLSLLDRVASCWWKCSGGDHRGEYLIGRCAVSANAAMRLIQSGYYDEALSVIRTLSERANLLALFAATPERFGEWKKVDDSTRRARFSPVRVRIALEEVNATVPIDKERYSALSGYAIHAGPETLPQAHNAAGRALAFAQYQEAGLLLCLNELAIAVGFIAVFAGKVVDLPASVNKRLKSYTLKLSDNIGGITVDVKGKPWFGLS